MSGLRLRLLVFGYPLLEVATAYLVAQWIGWGWMLLLLVAGLPVGMAIIRRARDAVGFLAGLLWLVPGFWTDLVGLVLLVPPVHAIVQAHSRTWIEGTFTTVRMPGVRYPGTGDVIQGTVIEGTVIPPEEPPGTSR